MSTNSAKPVNRPVVNVQPPRMETILSSRSSPQWASGGLPPTSPGPSPMLPSEQSSIQPGIPIYDLPSGLEGTLNKIKRIGGGAYSDVWLGLWRPTNADSLLVAMKCIRRVNLNADPEDKDGQTRFETRIKREAFVWRAVKHHNILDFCGFQSVEGDPVFVSPWCHYGNLRQFVKSLPGLDGVMKLELLRDAAQGLVHLHALEPPIIHGDIKPDNIMVTNDIRGVLCDFGISRVMTSLGMHSGLTTAGGVGGPAAYQAIELMQAENARPTDKSDVFSFGGLILATMTGKSPFWQIRSNGYIVTQMVRGITPKPEDHLELPSTNSLWVLMRKCWDPLPIQRPSMKEIIGELGAEIGRRAGSGSADT